MVAKLFERLPPLSKREENKILNQMLEKTYVFNARNKTFYCEACGHEIKSETIPEVCPHCERKIVSEYGRISASAYMYRDVRVSNYYRSYITENFRRNYFSTLTTCNGWQVIRTYFAKLHSRRKKPCELWVTEVHQWWVNDKGEYVLVSRPSCINPYTDRFNLWGDMEIRGTDLLVDGCRRYSGYDHRLFFGDLLSCRLIPKVKRNGMTRELISESGNYLSHIVACVKNHAYESILKSKQDKLVRWLMEDNCMSLTLPPYHCVRLCDRHGYVIDNPQMWIDHLNLLRQLGKDMHSPHYVCPTDLREQHNELLREKAVKDEREAEKQRRLQSYAENEAYVKSHARFLGIRFGNENLKFHVLQSASEVYEEGKAMHHCVYSCGYYKKADTLLLSCRDAEGKRIETIEINTRRYSIEQSRGVNNSETPQHKEILSLVNANMHLIRIAKEGGIQQNLKFAA